MRMVGYGRVSTDHEEQRDSLEHQQAFFQDFARARGHTLVRVYADQGISGKWLKSGTASSKCSGTRSEGSSSWWWSRTSPASPGTPWTPWRASAG